MYVGHDIAVNHSIDNGIHGGRRCRRVGSYGEMKFVDATVHGVLPTGDREGGHAGDARTAATRAK